MTEYVVGFERIDQTSVELAGGKGANLGELTRVGGIGVPNGFCVTTEAYVEVVSRDRELGALLEELSTIAPADAAAVRSTAARIRAVVEAVTIPAGIADQIGNHLDRIDGAGAYAVRSSATAEDLPTASFAGQQDTYLNVTGKDAIVEHVRKCWASLFTERAVVYRLQHGIENRSVRLAVVVQRMVFPEVAGVMFTADPITSDRTVTSIDAGFGLGEALVSGLANADNYRVRDGRITERVVADQRVAVHAVPGGGTEQAEVEDGRRNLQKLTDAQILRLAEIGQRIERHFGRPQDIEWSLADDSFFVVQSRPITTLFPVPGARDGRNHVYMSFGHQQMMTEAMKPLGLSFFQIGLEDTPLVEAGGRFFIDLAPDLAAPVGRRLALASMARIDPLIDGGIRDLTRRKEFMAGLARGGRRYLSLKGAGYFSWRLPVEAVKLYRRNDPTTVDTLRARHDSVLEELPRRLGGLSGDELFETILDDLSQLKDAVIDPRSMGAVYVGVYALSWVNKHMAKWLGEKGAGDVIARSVANDVTSQMGLALLDVADAVRNHPAVLAALPGLTDDTFFAELMAVEGGDEVGRSIREFLEAYGMRCSGEIDITRPRWSESPSTLVPMIINATRSLEPGARTARVEQGRRAAADLQQSLVDRLERMRGGRRKVRKTRTMISRLQSFAGYREYPKYLMMRHYWLIKQAMLAEAARLLEQGAVQQADDVYYLSFGEFREAARTGRVDHQVIAQRKDEFAAWERLTPPRLITSDGEVPVGEYDTTRVPAGALAGISASAGTVEGRARVILDLADADLEDGDILVTTFTDPSWTPVFLTVRGVVTEVGGAMTHGAVVAREYGLPAVVGVDGATRHIRDGQQILVNGTDGYVEIR